MGYGNSRKDANTSQCPEQSVDSTSPLTIPFTENIFPSRRFTRHAGISDPLLPVLHGSNHHPLPDTEPAPLLAVLHGSNWNRATEPCASRPLPVLPGSNTAVRKDTRFGPLPKSSPCIAEDHSCLRAKNSAGSTYMYRVCGSRAWRNEMQRPHHQTI